MKKSAEIQAGISSRILDFYEDSELTLRDLGAGWIPDYVDVCEDFRSNPV